jgi:uncharacterized membrane protein YedE/YeeE
MSTHPYFLLIAASFALGCGAGYIMHRSDFCIAGMFRDWFLFGSTYMLRVLMLVVVASMVLFEVARLLGLLAYYPFPLLGPPSLVNLVGGALFGLGMVLAGGCVVGTLYKMGAGSLLSAVAFVGLIAGSALYAEIHPWWNAVARATILTPGRVTVPQMLGISPSWAITALAAGAAYFFYRWYRQDLWRRNSAAEGYLQPWQAGLLLALIGLTSAMLAGVPLGITTAYSKLGASLETLVLPEHVSTLSYFKLEPLRYAAPLGHVSLHGGPGPQLDGIAVLQFPLILGIVLGATLSALLLRELRVYYRMPVRQYLSALLGGMIMGMASRMAPSCNVWHLLGGLPILAGQSILFLAGLLPGAWIGSRIVAGVVLKPSTVAAQDLPHAA